MISSADFQKITTLIFDVDGTLTDGREAFLPDGESVRFFHHHDMHWLKMAVRAGLNVGLLSAGDPRGNRQLAENLHLTFSLSGATDKVAGFEEILRRYALSSDECLYVGDDVIDMPVIRRAGIGVAVGDAVPELDEVARWRTSRPGGRGAARYQQLRYPDSAYKSGFFIFVGQLPGKRRKGYVRKYVYTEDERYYHAGIKAVFFRKAERDERYYRVFEKIIVESAGKLRYEKRQETPRF